ncbi:MAG TPA: type IV secretion system DNA-binding domain-containing protein [Candidatus Magasanikbacteria bacterium]|jgi:hypothetical protein|nr:type IV secretion system DNA-binding domain-containing protein [Candidatus Magasanikbacteria bacterium]HQF57132.1 type IV secretion system DNA-binding domain-containing protein [Candidatus Magasanikbacteria bacterium]HQL52908.1 type IV secretion system DNA-binding domain-containing protein [Candidatus Magasanikbacteria bacterium]
MSYITIGRNIFRGKTTQISYGDQDRLRHTYMIGKTGVGKSTVFQNMCLQDIENYKGVCFIDPHGESIDWLLQRIPPDFLEDVYLFDPSDIEFPFGLNLLQAKDEQEKDFLVSECIQIFYKLFDPDKTGIIGPQFEHWLRNAALTVMAGPEGGSLIEIPKLFVDKQFELKKRKYLKDPTVLEFWSKQMAKTSDFHKSEMLNYFSSKFGHFLNNAMMRNIIGQHKDTLDFDYLIEHNKILLVNLSKGKIGETNAQMLGLIIMSKLQAAILKRAKIEPEKRSPYYLYVDEFQNLVTDTFASLLSESRKYGLGVHLTNQYFAQLPEKIKDAILGNVGTIIAFEIGMEDAEILSKEFEPFTKEDFTNLRKYNFYIRLMIDGKTSKAFSGESLKPNNISISNLTEEIIKVNQLARGTPRILVEEQIKQALA